MRVTDESVVSIGAAQDVLQQGDWPTPELRSGEVLVHLHTTGVNPLM